MPGLKRMKAFLEPSEFLLREQVASGQFSSVEAAIQTVFGHRASQALESLLDEALLNPGRRVPVAELRRKQA